MTTEMVIEELIYENCSTNSTSTENAAKLVRVEKMKDINHDLHNPKI